MNSALPDLRPQLGQAQEWLATLIAGIGEDQWSTPTPCTEFDVRALTEHVFAVQERVLRMGRDGTFGDAPEALPFPSTAPTEAFRAAAATALGEWGEDRLVTPVTAPWGTMPGAAVLGGYLAEHVAHGWDLATATGQPAQAPAGLAEIALGVMRQALPAEGREHYPFGAVVPSAPDADPTEQLANWTGRVSR